MSYSNIKAIIEAAVYTNGNNEVEAQPVQDAMKSMVDVLGDYRYGGHIEPTDTFDDDSDTNWWYTANTNGTYTNFGGIALDDEIAIITYNGAFVKYIIGTNVTAIPNDSNVVLHGDNVWRSPSVAATGFTRVTYTSTTQVVINHGFGVEPAVTVLDTNGDEIEAYNVNSDLDTTTIDFDRTSSGVITLSAGSSGSGSSASDDYHFEFSLPEDVSNSDVYFFSWTKGTTSSTLIRSGNNTGISNANACSPIPMQESGTITSATLTLKGAGVQNGTVTYPVTYTAELWSVGFTTEGTKLADINFSISNSFTVGTFSVADTQFKGTTSGLSISVSAGDLLALKFQDNPSGSTPASQVAQMRNAFITLEMEEN